MKWAVLSLYSYRQQFYKKIKKKPIEVRCRWDWPMNGKHRMPQSKDGMDGYDRNIWPYRGLPTTAPCKLFLLGVNVRCIIRQ